MTCAGLRPAAGCRRVPSAGEGASPWRHSRDPARASRTRGPSRCCPWRSLRKDPPSDRAASLARLAPRVGANRSGLPYRFTSPQWSPSDALGVVSRFPDTARGVGPEGPEPGEGARPREGAGLPVPVPRANSAERRDPRERLVDLGAARLPGECDAEPEQRVRIIHRLQIHLHPA